MFQDMATVARSAKPFSVWPAEPNRAFASYTDAEACARGAVRAGRGRQEVRFDGERAACCYRDGRGAVVVDLTFLGCRFA